MIDPELKRPVTELDMVRGVRIAGDEVAVTIALTVAGCPLKHSFEEQVARALAPLGVTGTQVEFEVMTPDERTALTDQAPRRLAPRRASRSTRGRACSRSRAARAASASRRSRSTSPPPSSPRGEQVGILDADVYGHSIPHMLGIRQRPVVVDKMIVPPVKGDLKLMSIGFFLDENAPVMWRGPMLHRALEQFLSDVHWGEVDTLLVDMPPGTGDVAISLGQLLPRAEVVVVTTPQPAAQEVAVRAARNGSANGTARDRRDREHGRARSSAPAAARSWPRRSARPCSAAWRWIRGCVSAPTWASRWSMSIPTARPLARSPRSRRALASTRRGIHKQLPVLS